MHLVPAGQALDEIVVAQGRALMRGPGELRGED